MDRQLGKKLKTSRTFSGPFPSPESPPKGWYLERVQQTGTRGVRGYDTSAALLPFSSGRALPSKWDEAERWITSPVSVGNGSNLGYNAQSRAKSKSGPLGPLGPGSYGNFNTFSPVLGVGVINGAKWRHSIAIESGTEARDLLEGPDNGSGGGSDGDDGRRRSCPDQGQEWLDLWNAPLSPSDKRDTKLPNHGFETINNNDNDDNNNNNNNNSNNNNNNNNDNNAYDEAGVERVISRRDMATQMYPESESNSFSANSPRPLLNNEYETKMSIQNPEFEVRDVQIDRQTSRATQRSYAKGNEPIENISDCSSTIVVEDSKMFKLQREEARINAWENLQKAKAESAIQKLEMKLEKKRSSTMEKIIEKLRRAEIKAQKMRGSLGDGSDHVQRRVFSKTSSKIPWFFNKIRFSSSRSCLTCYPF